MVPIDTLPDFPELCLWMLGAAALSAGVWGVVVVLPGTRDRCIFRRNQAGPLRWLRGEYSVACTMLTGGPVAAPGLWWVSAAGLVPAGIWLHLAVALWCLLLAVALLNAARKSHPEGAACAGVVILVTLLLLGAGVLVLRCARLLTGTG
ncbi:hypothetical protein [Yokenella regensburgei]|uniref:DUF2182 domain-containing protein n=1 Tax=Yokenella regensburgei TaxID=158877 RepID=A0AB38FVL8_9ENTR|nr:hypothetical protein [Yokenella regensburgei]KFD24785.1 hypothetical protein GYRE_00754 [Yokenella regensburgei ATCC 49455]SQA62999.1 Uncharacterised protein [Yokenella regensburgei]SQB02243.1 Uncharacterised protein [Yokenella regensburgei]SUQ07457.1 Uncharacterised protein [Yokenella regensburgei]